MRLKNNLIFVVTGVSGVGKSWICDQLRDSYHYVRYDDGHDTAVSRLIEASLQDKFILFDPTVNFKKFVKEIPNAFFVIFVVNETEEIVNDRLRQRGGSLSESAKDRIKHFQKYADKPGYFCGTSQEVLTKLRMIAKSRYYVYELWEDSSNKPIYVGKGQRSRFGVHQCRVNQAVLGKKCPTHNAFYQYVARRLKSGDTFRLNLSCATNDEQEAYNREADVIAQFKDLRTLFNVDCGNNGPRGKILVPRREISDETKQKLSDARKGFKFNRNYANKGCWRLSDDEIELICDARQVEELTTDEEGHCSLSDDEVQMIKNRRNLLKYHSNIKRKQQVLDWHQRKIDKDRRKKAENLQLVEIPDRITHLAALTKEKRHERRLKLAALHRKRRLAERSDNQDAVTNILAEIHQLETSYGVKPVQSKTRNQIFLPN